MVVTSPAAVQGAGLQEIADAIPESITRWTAVLDPSGAVVDFAVTFANVAARQLLNRLAGPGWLMENTRVSTMGEVGERAFAVLREAFGNEEPVLREIGGDDVLRRHIATYAWVTGTDAVVVTTRDIHDRWLAERALAAAEARARALVEQSPAATIVLDEHLYLVQANDAAATLLGCSPGALCGRDVGEVLGEAPRTSLSGLLACLPLSAEPGDAGRKLQLTYRRPDGEDRLLRLTVGVGGRPGGELSLVGYLRDVTDEASVAARLEHEATHDPLTALPNRLLLMSRLRQALARWQASGEESRRLGRDDASEREAVCLIFVDLDGLKAVNDSWGHAAGDELLVDAAHRIGSAVRPQDIVARLGGDEFVVLLDEPVTEMIARRVGGRIRRSLGQPFVLRQGVSTSGGSVGVALSQAPVAAGGPDSHSSKIVGDTAETLLARADGAMYVDKMARRALRSA